MPCPRANAAFQLRYRRDHCHHCGCERTVSKQTPRHLLHGILTVFTCGLWGVSWLATAVYACLQPWRCRSCGEAVAAAAAATPPDGLPA